MAMDAYALIAQAKVAAEEISGAQFNPSLGYTNLSLEQASGKVVDEDVARAKSTPQSPADPRWQRRLPPPPCEYKYPADHSRWPNKVCEADHKGRFAYDHPYVHPIQAQRQQEAQAMIDPYAAAVVNGYGGLAVGNAAPSLVGGRRVAIYCGRGDSFVLKVEENPPDWDDVFSKKVNREQAQLIMAVVRALGVKSKDLTGGELEGQGDESQQGAERVAPSVAARANRPREDIQREWEELLPGTTPPSAGAADSLGVGGQNSGGQEVGAAHSAGDGEDSARSGGDLT